MIEFGKCMVCDKDIAPKCPTCNVRSRGSDYTEVTVEWSNGSKMPIAVCLACAKSHAWNTAHAKARITESHHQHWSSQGGSFDRGVVIV